MKVEINKYPNRLTCRIHDRYMDKKYGVVDWPVQYTDFEKFLEKVEQFVQVLYSPINFFLDMRERKVIVRIDHWDTWNADDTLAHIILPVLVQLKRSKHGAPNVDPEDVPENMRPGRLEVEQYKMDGTTDALFFKRWDWVLDEMIWAFNEHLKEWDEAGGKFHTGDPDFISIPIDKEGNEVAKEDAEYYRLEHGPNDTSHFDKEGYEAWQDRKQNGFRLFGKYYTALWD